MSARAESDLLAADSFRVRVSDGRAEARGLDRHLDRFIRTALAAWPSDSDPRSRPTERIREFLSSALPEIAAHGEGFPRLELWNAPDRVGELRLSLRPLPELRETIELRTAGPIELRHPERKGPNMPLLASLNRELGAEAVLTDRTGSVVEGATTSLIWWDRAAARGWIVDGDRRVASVTESLILASAREGGRYEIREARIAAGALPGHEVWAVNALHGIRPVTRLDGTPLAPPDSERLGWFRDALDRTWQPVTG